MTLKDIVFRNLRRRKAKAAFVLAGLLIGVSTVVAVISYVDATTHDINEKLEKYGANILIVPKTENLSLSYGGLSLGGFSFEMEEIREQDLKKVYTIKNAGNIAALGPMVFGVINVNGRKVLLAGVDFDSAKYLKPWWNIQGAMPKGNQVLLGSEAAIALGREVGGGLDINGRQFQ
ncbi:MAG: ABC transporter permease, partial [Deltaproteobacteria bacterium]|nr:ABC transporter permease [Deltaproteobacteria bacterium]